MSTTLSTPSPQAGATTESTATRLLPTNTDERPSRLALVFPPGLQPSSPPLGLAQLKSYLIGTGCSNEMRLFDLNLAHYELALQWMREGRLKMRLQGMDDAASARQVSEACRLFKTPQPLDSFLDPEIYDRCASIYRSFENVLNGLFENFARRLCAGLPIPRLAAAYLEELIQPVREFEADLAGFSILFSQQLYFALALAKLLKRSGAKVILGGATLSVMPEPERLLGASLPVYVGSKCYDTALGGLIDHLIVGEGEAALAALLSQPAGRLAAIPGVIHAGEGKTENHPAPGIEDLNSLPLPDFSDFALHQYHSPLPVLPYLTSRGCFWNRCSFCTHGKTYLAYREEAIERTVARLGQLQERYGVGHFNLVDEMIHPNRLGRFARLIDEYGYHLHYSVYAKPTVKFDRLLLTRMRHSGARVIMWGVESGHQRVLDAMRKGTRVEDMGRALRSAHGAGIWNLVFLMFGFPSETRAEWEATLRFLESHRNSIDALSKATFVLLPGSEVFKYPDRYGITRVSDRPQRDPISVAYDYEVIRGLTQSEVQALYGQHREVLGQYGRSSYFGLYRDHFLIHAAYRSQRGN